MTIKVTKLSEPKHREIRIECPHCKRSLLRDVPLDAKEGTNACGFCGTELKWEEVEK